LEAITGCPGAVEWAEGCMKAGVGHSGIIKDGMAGKSYIPMDPSTFLGSVWGIIYYRLEG
jgi:hypothetical protein